MLHFTIFYAILFYDFERMSNMGIYQYKTTVQFSDINEDNKLSSKGLIRILAESAGSHSEAVGYGLNSVEKTHLTWMVLNWKIKIISRPHWNTELTIKTWPRTFGRASSNRDFEIYDTANNLVAIATSKWVPIDTQTNSIKKISQEVIDAFGEVNNTVFETDVNDKQISPANSKFVYDYKVKRRDIDTNHHVNNLYYLDFAYDALPEQLWNQDFKDIEILYKKQIKLDDTIKCFYFYDNLNDEHIVTIKNEDLSIVHSIIKFH